MATNQNGYPDYPWQGTDTAAVYTGTLLQPYNSTNIMNNFIVLNNNLYSVYRIAYNDYNYLITSVVSGPQSVLHVLGYTDSAYIPFGFDNTVTLSGRIIDIQSKVTRFQNYSSKLANIEQKVSALTGGESGSGGFTFSQYSSLKADTSQIRQEIEPMFISQSISLLAGLLVGVAFVMAVKTMKG